MDQAWTIMPDLQRSMIARPLTSGQPHGQKLRLPEEWALIHFMAFT
jgi:hypothetical protein